MSRLQTARVHVIMFTFILYFSLIASFDVPEQKNEERLASQPNFKVDEQRKAGRAEQPGNQ